MKLPNKKNLIIALLLLFIAGGIVWWLMSGGGSSENRYVTANLERGSLTQTVSANGTLNPVKLVSVGSQVSGIVQKLHVDFNDKVRAGQILLELDPSLTQAQLQQSLANIANMEAQLELATANEARTRGLFAQEYVTRQEMEQSVQTLKSARAQLALVQAQADRDRTNRANTVIRSPVSGVVVSRLVDTGQTVAASMQAPILFTIAQDLSKMQIFTSYAEADVGAIHIGQAATFRVDAFPNRSFKGVVYQVRLNPTTQQNVVTYNVVVAVDNPDQKLMPGMTAYVNIAIAQRQDVLILPNAALRFRPVLAAAKPGKSQAGGGKPQADNSRGAGRGKDGAPPMGTVYVLENGEPKPVRVSVGISDNRFTEIIGDGIKEGVAIIVEDRQPPVKASASTGMRMF